MSDKTAKLIRSQVRNVCQEITPDILKQEVFELLYNRLREEIINRMAVVEANVNKALDDMAQRQKDVQGLLVREITAQQSFKPTQNINSEG